MAKKEDILLDHDYDGIKEYDNDMPPWWVWLFYLSIVFSVVYLVYYTFTDLGPTQAEEYMMEINPNWVRASELEEESGLIYHSPFYSARFEVTPRVIEQFSEYVGPKITADNLIIEAMRRADDQKLSKLQASFPELWEQFSAAGGTVMQTPVVAESPVVTPAVDEPKIESLTSDLDMAAGKDIYDKNCMSCHMAGGGGGIGPNFTDDYWIHGAGMNNMIRTINNGVPAKGMISWRGILSEKQIQQVSSYILTLHETNPPKPKAPQGNKVEYPLN